jgi:hypothetical protein
MRLNRALSALVVLGVWARPDACAQFQRTPRPPCLAANEGATVYGVVRSLPSNVRVRFATVTVEGTSCSTESDSLGQYVLRGVRPGRVALRAGFIGFHPANDTVQVAAGDSIQIPLLMGDMEEVPDPYTTDPLPATERRAAALAVFMFYRGRPSTEVAGYLETHRITGTPVAPPPSGESPLVIWFGGSDAVYQQDRAWARAQKLPVCWAKQESGCAGRGVTRFLGLSAPVRVSPDSVVIPATEYVTDPAECRLEKTFVGLSEANALVVRDRTGWQQVRFLDTVNLSGFRWCQPT